MVCCPLYRAFPACPMGAWPTTWLSYWVALPTPLPAFWPWRCCAGAHGFPSPRGEELEVGQGLAQPVLIPAHPWQVSGRAVWSVSAGHAFGLLPDDAGSPKSLSSSGGHLCRCGPRGKYNGDMKQEQGLSHSRGISCSARCCEISPLPPPTPLSGALVGPVCRHILVHQGGDQFHVTQWRPASTACRWRGYSGGLSAGRGGHVPSHQHLPSI